MTKIKKVKESFVVSSESFSAISGENSAPRSQASRRAYAIERGATLTWSHFRLACQVVDVVAVMLSGILANRLVNSTVSPAPNIMLLIYFSAAFMFAIGQLAGRYQNGTIRANRGRYAVTMVSGVSSVAVVVFGYNVTSGLEPLSALWTISWMGMSGALASLNTVAFSYIVNRYEKDRILCESVAIVGTAELTGKVLSKLYQERSPAVEIIGIFDDKVDVSSQSVGSVRLRGTVDDLVALARSTWVDRIIVALPWRGEEDISEILRKLRTVPARIELCLPDVIWRSAVHATHLHGIPLVTVANGRVGRDDMLLKNIVDRVGAAVLLVALLPLLLLIALLIKLDSRGPVLFTQPRYGFNNRVFNVYKYRTMRQVIALDPEVTQARRGDPRVTFVGRILRKYSLDELPQLVNVIKGEMSIVGPRPHAVPHNLKYARIFAEYPGRHNVKPGITGWAQVHGYRGETDTDEKMRKRMEYDLHYVENWSLLLDIKIIIMTVVKVWFQKTAY